MSHPSTWIYYITFQFIYHYALNSSNWIQTAFSREKNRGIDNVDAIGAYLLCHEGGQEAMLRKEWLIL